MVWLFTAWMKNNRKVPIFGCFMSIKNANKKIPFLPSIVVIASGICQTDNNSKKFLDKYFGSIHAFFQIFIQGVVVCIVAKQKLMLFSETTWEWKLCIFYNTKKISSSNFSERHSKETVLLHFPTMWRKWSGGLI